VNRYQKGKTNLDFTEVRDSEWQWHQLGHMQICTLLQTGNHASTPPLSFLQAGCPSCCPTNSVKALKAKTVDITANHINSLRTARSQAVAVKQNDLWCGLMMLFDMTSFYLVPLLVTTKFEGHRSKFSLTGRKIQNRKIYFCYEVTFLR